MGPSRGYPGTVKQVVAGSYHRAHSGYPIEPQRTQGSVAGLPRYYLSKALRRPRPPPRTSLAPRQPR